MKFLLLPDIGEILTKLINDAAGVIPNLIAALVIAIIGIIVSKIVASLVRKGLQKLKVDKLGEKLNEIEMVSKANAEIKLSSIFSKAIYYFMVLFFMVAAAETLNMPAVSDLFKGIFNFFPKLLVALIIMILGILFAEFIRKLLATTMKSLGIPSAAMISNFVFYFLFINIFIVALSQADIDTGFLSQNISLIIGGIVAAFAIAYGLASKDTVANYVASFSANRNIAIGDRVTVDGVTGIVSQIDRTTVVITTESSKVIMPLNKMVSEKIEIHQ